MNKASRKGIRVEMADGKVIHLKGANLNWEVDSVGTLSVIDMSHAPEVAFSAGHLSWKTAHHLHDGET